MQTSGTDREDSKDGDLQDHAPERPRTRPLSEDERRRAIEVAAYYAAEKRGFADDRALDDWLEAERHIDSRAAEAGVKHEVSVSAEPPDGDARGDEGVTPGAEPERERIAPDDVKRWAATLGVPAPRLRDAIKKAGPFVDDVRRHLEASD